MGRFEAHWSRINFVQTLWRACHRRELEGQERPFVMPAKQPDRHEGWLPTLRMQHGCIQQCVRATVRAEAREDGRRSSEQPDQVDILGASIWKAEEGVRHPRLPAEHHRARVAQPR